MRPRVYAVASSPRAATEQSFSGGYGGRATPDPIPNSVVKPSSADGTAGETLWESRTPPDLWPPRQRGGLFIWFEVARRAALSAVHPIAQYGAARRIEAAEPSCLQGTRRPEGATGPNAASRRYARLHLPPIRFHGAAQMRRAPCPGGHRASVGGVEGQRESAVTNCGGRRAPRASGAPSLTAAATGAQAGAEGQQE